MQTKQSDFRRIVIISVLTAAAIWVLLYAPTPYVVFEPGVAVPVKPMVTIEDGDSLGKGDFLLTAVKLTEPNFLRAIQSLWNTNADVYLKKDVLRGYSKEQYAERLNVIMLGSQNNAVEAAYRYAGLPYAHEAQAIIVTDVRANGATAFKTGDTLLGLSGGKRFNSIAEAVETLKTAGQNKETSFDIERDGERQSVTLSSKSFDSSLTEARLPEALGVTGLTELRSLEPGDSRNRLKIAAGEIGGPSAGLVFALHALDLLTPGDLSGGHRIAATGTITVDGKVGAIGGIKQKVVIASSEGAQLFLVPAANFEEAQAKVSSLGSQMKVVRVGTLQEAMDSIEMFNNKNAT